MNDENNRVLHELLGKCWHDFYGANDSRCGFCIYCGKHRGTINRIHPDYADDPRLVLEGMRERDREDWDGFCDYAGFGFSREHDFIPLDLVLDQTGRLRELAIEFFKQEKK